MSLESYLEELADNDKPLIISRLTELSALSQADIKALRNAWGDISKERRREIVGHMVTLAEANVDLDFNDVFITGIGDPDETVREISIEGLWECERSSLIKPLIGMLMEDPCTPVRSAAALSLGKFALLAELGKLSENDGARVEAALLETIRKDGEDIEVRRHAIEAISSLSLPVVAEVIWEAYNHDDVRMKASAIYAMGMNSDPAWMPMLIEEMHSEDPELRFEAAKACGEIEEAEAVPHLLTLIRDEDTQVRIAAIEALGRIGGDDAEAALQQCAGHSEQYVRDAVTEALEEIRFNSDPLSTDSFE